MKNPMGAGFWMVDFGLCGELLMYLQNEERVKNKECKVYFSERLKDVDKANFSIDIAKAKVKSSPKGTGYSNELVQIFLILFPGLLLPYAIAFVFWRGRRLEKFPLKMSLELIFASIVGAEYTSCIDFLSVSGNL